MARIRTDRLLPSARRRGRKGRVYLLLLLVGLGAAFYAVWHRHALAPIPPHAFVSPTVTGQVALPACWLETGRFLTFTASGILVRHPRGGDILIDSGNSSHFDEEVATQSLGTRALYRVGARLLKPSLTMPQALSAAGVEPARLKAVLISHLHLDHLGGAMDLPPQTAIWTTQPELDFISQARGTFHGVPSQMDVLKTRGLPITFQKRPYESFDESADLFGDGSVVVVKLPGHTPGSVGVFINVSVTRRLLYVGDAVNELAEVDQNLSKRGSLRFTDVDPAQAARTVALLSQLRAQDPSLFILPAHDRSAFEKAFGGEPRCLP